MTDPIPAEVLEALHQGRVPDTPLTKPLAEQVLGLMQAGALPWPQDEAVWGWSGWYGECVLAFESTNRGVLPEGFTFWHLEDPRGWTVAHVAAEYGHLPPDFSLWHLADSWGRTVAHAAAEYGHPLPDLEHWFLTDAQGRTVVDVALEHGAIDQARYDQIMLEHEQSERAKAASTLTMSF